MLVFVCFFCLMFSCTLCTCVFILKQIGHFGNALNKYFKIIMWQGKSIRVKQSPRHKSTSFCYEISQVVYRDFKIVLKQKSIHSILKIYIICRPSMIMKSTELQNQLAIKLSHLLNYCLCDYQK